MRLFKYILTSFVFVIVIKYSVDSLVNQQINSHETSIKNLYKVDENAICTKDNKENFTTIAQNEQLIYQSGQSVIEEVSKNFSNPLIPSSYRISESDLQQGHALIKDEEMVLTVLEFIDEDKFGKVSEFFTLGQAVVGYELKVDDELNIVMISFDFNDLDYYSKLYYDQKCY